MKFQSTPVSEDGRTVLAGAAPLGKKGFNPRPSVKTGERYFCAVCPPLAEFQSTPVSEDGRTLLWLITTAGTDSFNPRPSVKTGEPMPKWLGQFAKKVSIHARQ